MEDILARLFVAFILVVYTCITLMFVIGAVRKWIWGPIASKVSAYYPERNYHRIKSTTQEGSPS